ncbi:hypothetical protein Ahy_B03g067327 isoform B [Arachis hypogaea]|uniref:Pentacotripeptide-repeat region of PRORP domain-containing protein n=1 Tax=Arachis hypogaea TaxID=3818 RepID=A0A445A6G5_ARAHY|nr:hypothetical protein Ahy_B03g067327 isoform B [Arachis hypogaea]
MTSEKGIARVIPPFSNSFLQQRAKCPSLHQRKQTLATTNSCPQTAAAVRRTQELPSSCSRASRRILRVVCSHLASLLLLGCSRLPPPVSARAVRVAAPPPLLFCWHPSRSTPPSSSGRRARVSNPFPHSPSATSSSSSPAAVFSSFAQPRFCRRSSSCLRVGRASALLLRLLRTKSYAQGRKKPMPQFANSRFYSCLLQHRLKALPFSTQQEGMASVSDTLYGHLKDKNYGSVERSLSKFKPKLDSRCVMEVMSRCYPQDPQLGLRFFIWAGFQSGYRHSAYMYRKACKLLGIDKNPSIVCDVIGSYENEGCFVNVNMFRVVFKLCKEAELCDVALWVFRKLGSFSMRADTVMYNVVISLCCKKGEIEMAGVLMREMSVNGLHPDSITYMAIIEGLCDAGQLDDAYSVLEVMRLDGCSPSSVVLSAVLDGFCRSGSMERALKLLDEMEKEGGNRSPNVVTYTSVIQSFCKRGQHAEAFDILDRMKAHGCRANHVAVFIILESLCAEGHLEEAHRLIDKFVEEHDVSYGQCYSSFVVSLIKIRQLDEAEKLFRKMLAGKIKPDTFSCSLLLKELCMKGRLLNGFYLLDEIENMGYLYSIDIDIYFILLIGLCRSNHLIEAAKLARIMLKKSVPLRRPNAYSALNILSKYGEQDLVNQLLGMQKRFR